MGDEFIKMLGIERSEATKKIGEFTLELMKNINTWKVADLVEWMVTGDVVDRKIKATLVVTLLLGKTQK